MARSRGSFPARRATRNPTDWIIGPDTNTLSTMQLTAAGKLLSVGIAPTIGKLTVIRTRGDWHLEVLRTQGASEGVLLAMGIAVFTSDAFAIGPTAVPGPITDMEWNGWLWHQFVSVDSTGAASQVALDNDTFFHGQIDSKAMRKIDETQVMALCFEFADEVGTVTATLRFQTRMLSKNLV